MMDLSKSLEDYLETILALQKANKVARVVLSAPRSRHVRQRFIEGGRNSSFGTAGHGPGGSWRHIGFRAAMACRRGRHSRWQHAVPLYRRGDGSGTG